MAPLSSASGYLFTNPKSPRLPQTQFQAIKTTTGTITAPRATKITAFFTATMRNTPTSKHIATTTMNTQTTALDTLNPTFTSSFRLVTADPYTVFPADAAADGCSSCPDRRLPTGPDPTGPDVIRPVGCSAIGPDPDDFLDMGPDPLSLPTAGPEFGPDLTDPDDGRDGFWSTPGISNIFPSSPDFFGSPPVYGTEREVIVGGRSFSCSGRPDTYRPLLSWWEGIRVPIWEKN